MSSRIPRVYRAEAIVLRQRRLGEADRILTLYTAHLGKVEAVAKGVRKQTSRKAGHLEPLNWTSVLMAHGQNLDIITQSETVEGFLTLRQDLQRLSRGIYVAELTDRFSAPRVENYLVFRLLTETLQRLAVDDALDLAVRFFEMQLLSHMGYRPQLDRCVTCSGDLTPVVNAFSAPLGGVVCPACRADQVSLWPLSVNALKLLRLLQRGEFTTAARLRLLPELAHELEIILRGYIRFLLETSPRSLVFVDALRHDVASSYAPAARLVAERDEEYRSSPTAVQTEGHAGPNGGAGLAARR
jgi:DNA repair protein RecO (recombination protein O)